MGAIAVGTTVVGQESKPSKWHCHCVLNDEKEVFIVVRARTAAYASVKVHENYPNVEYVLDVLTHDEMEYKKRHLKPSIVGGVTNY